MGNCSPPPEKDVSPEEQKKKQQDKETTKRLDMEFEKEQEQQRLVNKLLLLGAGESGKSTLFKQMIKIYGDGFSENERKNTYIKVVHTNVIANIKTLVQQSEHHYGEMKDIEENIRAINELKGDEDLNEKLANHIAVVWAHKGIQATYEKRNLYQLNDSCKYFLDRIKLVCAENYLPTDEDILGVRVRTTGIVSNEFTIDGNKFQMFDVGGQRNERKKWIHCFEGVTAVIFVAAMSEYDQVLYEDENVNRMTEALTLFDEICNSRWFKRTSMLLFLNKCDLFADKILKKPITLVFPDYTGPQEYEASARYIENQFLSRNRVTDSHATSKKIYTHVTCATNTTNVRAVFTAVKDIIIRGSLAAAGLV
jgi:GTPase SAR1 family protein